MPTVKFTRALNRFFPKLTDTPAKGVTLTEILSEMETYYPGVRSYLLDDQGRLRQHVNIFIDSKMISDRTALSDSFSQNSEIYIIQALSGG
jgi:molybdopterin synthase sulfur carrier subunit